MKNRKGFTIVELVIVIAVIAILAAVLIPTFTTVTANARASAAQSQAKNAQEAMLSNTEGQMPENTLFAINSDSKADADYFFVIENRKLEQKDVKKFAADTKYPQAEASTDYAGGIFSVFVSAGRFGTEMATDKKDNIDALIKDVLDYKLSGKDGKKDGTNVGSWVATADTAAEGNDHNATPTGIKSNPLETSAYAVWKYQAKDGETTALVKVYYNADLADTCVAFIAQ